MQDPRGDPEKKLRLNSHLFPKICSESRLDAGFFVHGETFEDLYSEQDRYWFDTRPNLRREMESRKQNIEKGVLNDLIKQRVTRVFGRNHHFGGVHVFTPSVDIPDDYGMGPRLVVLPSQAAYNRGESNPAYSQAEKILRKRGDQPRKKQNRLIFLAPDFDVVGRMKEQGRIYLAWDAIVTDIENGTLNQDISHLGSSPDRVGSLA